MQAPSTLTTRNEVVNYAAYVTSVLRSKVNFRTALRLLVLTGAAALFVGVVSAADVHRVSDLVEAVGLLGVLVILAPQFAAVLAESFGWKLGLRAMGCRVPLRSLLRVRVATEALSQSLPAGVLFGESAKPLLLHRHAGLSVGEGVAALVARKYLLLLSQAAYVLVVAALGFGIFERISPSLLGISGLQWVAVGIGSLLAVAAFGMAVWLRQSAVARAVFAGLRKLPLQRLRSWLSISEKRFSETDERVSGFFCGGMGRHLVPAAWFVLGWAIESAETYVILRVLGVDVGFLEVASLEILLTFLRHVLFVVPAGLGVQDLGYVAWFAALGIPDGASVGAAFVLVKRTKELAWIALGYALLAAETKASRLAPAAPEPSRA